MTTPRERLAALPPLSAGAHEHVGEGACVMEAVAYVAGESWSDNPACACPVISELLRAWNDALTDADRDRLLRPFIPHLVGSRSTPEMERRRSWLATDWLVRTHTPAWLRLTPALVPHAVALTELPTITDAQTAAVAAAMVAAAMPVARDGVRRDAAAVVVQAAAGNAANAAAVWFASVDASRDAVRAARRAARMAAAAEVALQPTTATLQRSALELVDRMLATSEDEG